MSKTVLRSETIPAQEIPVLWTEGDEGSRTAFLNGAVVAAEDQDTYARAARYRAEIASDQSVAVIGGGFGVLPSILPDCPVTVYEIVPEFAQYCPPPITFIPGDWRVTLTGMFDVIVYDLGGDVPRDALQPHLNPGGAILP